MCPVGRGRGIGEPLRLEFGDDDRDIVDCDGTLLARRPVHVLEAGPGVAAGALAGAPAGAPAPSPAARAPAAAAWAELLSHQLRIQARLPGRRSFAYVAHEALEGLSRIAVRTNAAVPDLFLLRWRRLPLRTSIGTLL